jgi:uncharacterized protein
MAVLPIYASLLTILFVYLSIKTIRTRRSLGIGLGHAENPAMLRAMRVHANFAEYVPIALVLIFLVESSSAHAWFVHCLGGALVTARASHAFGVSRTPENFRFRIFGMVLTFTVLLVCAIYLLAVALTK